MAKILIIEDDADISAIERDYLELSGYQVAICADGTAGLSAALNEDYDLLLLDLMLPGRMITSKSPFPPACWWPGSRRIWRSISG